ncbi:MAG TPA: hypothetical protein V6C72_04430 [Chroococcales cyanobacterium]
MPVTPEIFIALVIGVLLGVFVWSYRSKRKQITAQLQAIDSPEAIETAHDIPVAMRLIRTKLKGLEFEGSHWVIKEDNPKGMLMAVIHFDQDFGPKVGRLNRQVIMTTSIRATESGGTSTEIFYSVFSPFSRASCDQIIQSTTSQIKELLLAKQA